MEKNPRSVVIEHVYPELDCGRFPVKREVGDTFEVSADIFKEGHDVLAAVLRYRRKDEIDWHETPMRLVDNDRWAGSFVLEANTRYAYTIAAFKDVFASWRDDLRKRVDAGQDVTSELLEGQKIVRDAAERARGSRGDAETWRHGDAATRGRGGAVVTSPTQRSALSAQDSGLGTRDADAERLLELVAALDPERDLGHAARVALGDELATLCARYPDRGRSTVYDHELEVVVDRVRARYAAWYEFFPRSAGRVPGRSATFREAEERLPAIREMGFDVVYLPPIHPIGHTKRKGPNNSLVAGPNDPGVPYAIGNEHGGHQAVEPALGTIADFDHFVARTHELGLEVALDFAIQCSPDHPYVREHPEWFYHRPDGSIKYAENPPKKYEDIYPVNFESENWRELWDEMKSVLLFWIDHGVKIFRVDNPHTKPVYFWEWLIGELQAEHPDVIFLSEAFTRPKMMKMLAKVGFTQSYTYFTWRNFKGELRDYLVELTQSEMKEYFRGNFFVNTPDILPTILQEGGRPAFKLRLALATTASSLYGMYSGYELCENTAVPGKEEYLNSEKYDYKVWDWDRPGNIVDYVTRLNQIRAANPALHRYTNLRLHDSSSDHVIFYSKMTPDRSNVVLVAVNLDPFEAHQTYLRIPIAECGIGPDEQYQVHELITDTRHLWKGETQLVTLDPQVEPAAIYRLQRWHYVDYESPCF